VRGQGSGVRCVWRMGSVDGFVYAIHTDFQLETHSNPPSPLEIFAVEDSFALAEVSPIGDNPTLLGVFSRLNALGVLGFEAQANLRMCILLNPHAKQCSHEESDRNHTKILFLFQPIFLDQQLGNLHCIQSRTFANLVATQP
jgi:hypothetical protein